MEQPDGALDAAHATCHLAKLHARQCHSQRVIGLQTWALTDKSLLPGQIT